MASAQITILALVIYFFKEILTIAQLILKSVVRELLKTKQNEYVAKFRLFTLKICDLRNGGGRNLPEIHYWRPKSQSENRVLAELKVAESHRTECNVKNVYT